MTLRQMMLMAVVVLTATVGQAKDADEQWLREGKQRIDRLCDLYNHDLNDSLIHQGARDLEFHRAHGCWSYYYETWMHVVNTYTFSGQVNTALQEVKQMHADATTRNDKYGLALANYAMGNAYNNMGYLDEAVNCYQQSIRLIDTSRIAPASLNDIYSYYCDALNEKKDYHAMGAVTTQWKAALDRMTREEGDKEDSSAKVWYAYYYLACAQQHLGLNMLDEAARDIDEADKRSEGFGDFIGMSVLYVRTQLYLQRKQYGKALVGSDEQLRKGKEYDDKSSLLLIYEQRADIMRGLGRYAEAAELYKNVYELSATIYKKDARTQINELNTLFHVNELEMEKRLSRNRNITTIVAIIAAALALLVGYGYWMNRRLRRKNDELRVARDQAQESARMKTDFIRNISHEIRTPLNILSGFTQVVTQEGVELSPEERREANDQIVENTNRIASLINRLLALSETNSRSFIERTDTVSCNELLAKVIAQSGVAESRRHHFTFDTQLAADQTITTNELYVIRAATQLLENAMKFTPEGDIRLRARQTDGQLEVVVEDTGVGVPADAADRIFGEFVQLDEYKEGVGVGLAVSRNIARRLGGDLALDTGYTGGARFVLTLPLT